MAKEEAMGEAPPRETTRRNGTDGVSRTRRVLYGLVAVLGLCGAVMTVVNAAFYGFPIMEMKIPLLVFLLGTIFCADLAIRGGRRTR